MPNLIRRLPKAMLLALLLALVVLPGARCSQSSVEVAPTIGASGPSSAITPVPGTGATWSNGSTPADASTGNLFNRVNSRRKSLGLTSLIWHDGLAAVSDKHSNDMLARSYFSLVTPEGVSIYQRLVSSSPRIDFANAYAFVTSSSGALAVFNALRATPAGLTAMDDPAMTHFGAGATSPGGAPATIIFGQNVVP